MNKKNPLIIFGFVLLGAFVIAAVLLLGRYLTRPRVTRFTPALIEVGSDTKLTVYGKNFPEAGQIEVSFSGKPGIIIGASEDSLLVDPDIAEAAVPPGGEPLLKNLFVKIKSKVIFSDVMAFTSAAPQIKSFSPVPLIKGGILTITGDHLEATALRVLINNEACERLSATPTELKVRIPDLGSSSLKVLVEVFNGNVQIYKRAAVVRTRDLDIELRLRDSILNLERLRGPH